MASKTLHYPHVKSGWYVSYFFQTESWYGWKISIPGYVDWAKPHQNSGDPVYSVGTFLYNGPDGGLTCIVECDEADKIDNSFQTSEIQPSDGSVTLGYTSVAAFEDFGGTIDYNDFFACIVSWSTYG